MILKLSIDEKHKLKCGSHEINACREKHTYSFRKINHVIDSSCQSINNKYFLKILKLNDTKSIVRAQGRQTLPYDNAHWYKSTSVRQLLNLNLHIEYVFLNFNGSSRNLNFKLIYKMLLYTKLRIEQNLENFEDQDNSFPL